MHKKIPNKFYFINSFKKINIDKLDNNTAIIFRNYNKKPNLNEIIKIKKYCSNKNIEFRSSNRDEVFQSIRVNNSLNKTRKILYDKLQEFYIEVNSLESSIIYIDSVNAKENIRLRFLESIEYDSVLYINFRINKENFPWIQIIKSNLKFYKFF